MAEKLGNILIVDDDVVNRRLVTRTLEKAGFDVKEAATASEALRLALAKPDLVILDVNLPDMSGFEVCRRLKADPATKSIAVLHVSAHYVHSEDRIHGLEGGADGYATRPIVPAELVATVKALLRARQAETHTAEMGSAPPVAMESPPLRESMPDLFPDLVCRYQRLIDLALEERQGKAANISEELRVLSNRLGSVNAGPRDVMDLHAAGLKDKTAQTYLEEGRILSLELMGRLVSFYRALALAAKSGPAPSGQQR